MLSGDFRCVRQERLLQNANFCHFIRVTHETRFDVFDVAASICVEIVDGCDWSLVKGFFFISVVFIVYGETYAVATAIVICDEQARF